MTAKPAPPLHGTIYTVVTLAADAHHLFALRDDGSVWTLVHRGEYLGGKFLEDPEWVQVPPLPGTLAALEREG